MNITYRLSDPKKARESGEPFAVYLDFFYNGKRYRINSGLKLKYSHFDPTKKFDAMVTPQYTRETRMARSFPTEILKNVTDNIAEVVDKHIKGYIPDHELKKRFEACGQRKKEKASSSNLTHYYKEFMQFKVDTGTDPEGNTYRTYETALGFFQQIEEDNPDLIIDVFNLGIDFFKAFHEAAMEREYMVSTYNKQLKNVRTLLNHLIRENPEVRMNMFYKTVHDVDTIKHQPIELLESEIRLLESHSLTNQSDRKNIDMFLFQMYTGQRFEAVFELSKNLDKINEDERIFYVWDQKIRRNREIPLIDQAMDIYYKYKELGYFPMDQNAPANKALKRIFRKLEIDRTVEYYEHRIGEKAPVLMKKPFHEIITTHIAKATFITQSIHSGLSFEQVSKFTGNTVQTMKYYDNAQAKDMKESVEKVFAKKLKDRDK